jgi:hypothetical protein
MAAAQIDAGGEVPCKEPDALAMKGHECYHCKQWIAAGEAHDCWTTTEAALTKDLSDDLQDAYERIRETAVALGEQRIYASHSSIMFARKSCYFFVRPKRSFLEVVIFLGRAVKSPRIKKVVESSKTKRAHIIQVRHRDEVEAPLTDWLHEAYDFEPLAKTRTVRQTRTARRTSKKR